jgi:multidrug resistance efflux pump
VAGTAPLKLNIKPAVQCQGPKPALAGQNPQERAIELSKRSLETQSLDELYFLLTNDTRTLIEFERAWLASHLGGPSRLAAANNQPALNDKSEFVDRADNLADALRGKEKALFLSSRIVEEDSLGDKVPPDLKEALKGYVGFSGFSHILIMPLVHNDATVGHLAFEFEKGKIPREDDILAVLNVTPFFAAALAEKSLLEEKPDLIQSLKPGTGAKSALVRRMRTYLPLWIAAAVALPIVFFVIPFSYTVGGEADIACKVNHFAFAGVEGLIDHVLVREGEQVTQGQTLARLDPKEVDYQVANWTSQYHILSQEIARLNMESGDNPAKLVERKVAELKREGAWNELQYLNWKKGFLEIKAPVSGIVITKDVQSLSGKRLGNGEPFCEIAVPAELDAQVYVPEDRISHVKVNQPVYVYLNSEPANALPLKVSEIAPAAEVRPRLGSVYRVKAPLAGCPPSVRVGMKGIGKIDTGSASLWHIVTSQIHTRWNQFALHF